MTHIQVLIAVGAVLFVFGFLLSALVVVLYMFAEEDRKRLLQVVKAKVFKRIRRTHR